VQCGPWQPTRRAHALDTAEHALHRQREQCRRHGVFEHPADVLETDSGHRSRVGLPAPPGTIGAIGSTGAKHKSMPWRPNRRAEAATLVAFKHAPTSAHVLIARLFAVPAST
jgi:hypothetical protein